MKWKIALILVLISIAVTVTFSGCIEEESMEPTQTLAPTPTPKPTPTPTPTPTYEPMQTFTKEELAQYNGKDGAKAFVAVEGVVCDVFNSRVWPQGKHMGTHFAGEDLTVSLAQAPHGAERPQKFPVVGTLKRD